MSTLKNTDTILTTPDYTHVLKFVNNRCIVITETDTAIADNIAFTNKFELEQLLAIRQRLTNLNKPISLENKLS